MTSDLTPDDVTAIRADRRGTDHLHRALCDALEAAWAERDAIKLDMITLDADWMDAHGRISERAERAEIEMRLQDRAATHWYAKWMEQGAALARVRALCDDDVDSDIGPAVPSAKIRAAIEGSVT